MEFFKSVKRPFQDLRTLFLGSLISWVPILNFVSIGFFLECIRKTWEGNNSLPEWVNWHEKFVDGIKAYGVLFVYSAAYLLIFFLSEYLLKGASIDLKSFSSTLTVAQIVPIFALILFAIIGIIIMIKEKKFSSAFNPQKISSLLFNYKFMASLIIASVIWIALTALTITLIQLLMKIPVIGNLFVYIGLGFNMFAGGIIFCTILADGSIRFE